MHRFKGVATTWAAYSWQTIPRDDRAARGGLFMHELFHRIQGGLGLTREMPKQPPGSGENAHLDSLEGRYWMRLEWRALARALEASGPARLSAMADALAFRGARQGRFPSAALDEHADELVEGIATYTQHVLAADTAQDAVRHALVRLAGAERDISFVQTFAYASGAGYGLQAARRRVVTWLASHGHWRARLRPPAVRSRGSDGHARCSRRRVTI